MILITLWGKLLCYLVAYISFQIFLGCVQYEGMESRQKGIAQLKRTFHMEIPIHSSSIFHIEHYISAMLTLLYSIFQICRPHFYEPCNTCRFEKKERSSILKRSSFNFLLSEDSFITRWCPSFGGTLFCS